MVFWAQSEILKRPCFSSDVTHASSGWRFKKGASGGGVLLDLGSHLTDMLRSFFGMPGSICGAASKIVSKDVEDEFKGEWIYPTFSGDVHVSWSRPDMRKATLKISVSGDNGQLIVSDDSIQYKLDASVGSFERGSKSMSITSLESAVSFDLAGPMYTRQCLEFIEAIQKQSQSSQWIG